jgi:hypothetical protein
LLSGEGGSFFFLRRQTQLDDVLVRTIEIGTLSRRYYSWHALVHDHVRLKL